MPSASAPHAENLNVSLYEPGNHHDLVPHISLSAHLSHVLSSKETEERGASDENCMAFPGHWIANTTYPMREQLKSDLIRLGGAALLAPNVPWRSLRRIGPTYYAQSLHLRTDN